MEENNDLIGKRFGRLVILEKTKQKDRGRNSLYKCKCDCGNEILVPLFRLQRKTKSCGCRQKELASEKIADEVGMKDETNLSVIALNKPNKNSKTGIRGVCYISRVGKYRAQIRIRGKNIYLGDYNDLESAKKARQAAEYKYFAPILEDEGNEKWNEKFCSSRRSQERE